jgi:4-amino-4-deoxy-L-arabinose transferase-like glycosyltransferase
MKVELAIAGLGWFVLGAGHATIGLRWVLPRLTEQSLPSTPLGSPTLTLNMLRFTWNIVSVVQVAFGVLLMALALAPDADPKTLLLRWFVAFLLVATALACWPARRRPRSILRLPVPLVFMVIAVLCWTAST